MSTFKVYAHNVNSFEISNPSEADVRAAFLSIPILATHTHGGFVGAMSYTTDPGVYGLGISLVSVMVNWTYSVPDPATQQQVRDIANIVVAQVQNALDTRLTDRGTASYSIWDGPDSVRADNFVFTTAPAVPAPRVVTPAPPPPPAPRATPPPVTHPRTTVAPRTPLVHAPPPVVNIVPLPPPPNNNATMIMASIGVLALIGVVYAVTRPTRA